MGYDVKIQGKRFPVPTTLNELGEDWSFDSGDTSKRESGAYDGQRYWRVGNSVTSEWYEAGTKKRIYDTGAILCYKKIPVLSVGLDELREDGKYNRNTRISGVHDSKKARQSGYLELFVNGIYMGDILDQSIEKKMGSGLWETTKYDRIFRKRENGMSISFLCALKSAKVKAYKKQYIIDSISIGPHKKRSKTPMGSA